MSLSVLPACSLSSFPSCVTALFLRLSFRCLLFSVCLFLPGCFACSLNWLLCALRFLFSLILSLSCVTACFAGLTAALASALLSFLLFVRSLRSLSSFVLFSICAPPVLSFFVSLTYLTLPGCSLCLLSSAVVCVTCLLCLV